MGKIIIECPSCQHVHKLSDKCDTCSQEREWEVFPGSLRCKTCKYGIREFQCANCKHTIPMILDFVHYFKGYEDMGDVLPEVVDDLLAMHRYSVVLDALQAPWIKYEAPAGYPLAEKISAAKSLRSAWLWLGALAAGLVGGVVGGILLSTDPTLPSFLPWLAAIAGAVVAAMFVSRLGGNWGMKNGKFIDMGMIVLSGALGWLAVAFVCGGIVVMIVFQMLSS